MTLKSPPVGDIRVTYDPPPVKLPEALSKNFHPVWVN